LQVSVLGADGHVSKHGGFARKVGNLDGQRGHHAVIKHAWIAVEADFQLGEGIDQQGNQLIVHRAGAARGGVDQGDFQRVSAGHGADVHYKLLLGFHACAHRQLTQQDHVRTAHRGKIGQVASGAGDARLGCALFIGGKRNAAAVHQRHVAGVRHAGVGNL